jgi:hypothetical protein
VFLVVMPDAQRVEVVGVGVAAVLPGVAVVELAAVGAMGVPPPMKMGVPPPTKA